MVSGSLVPCTLRTLLLTVLVGGLGIGLSTPLLPSNLAGASGDRYNVSNWKDPQGKDHRVRWNPCQPAITYAVNPRLSGKTKAARNSALEDVRRAFRRVGNRTGITFRFEGKTDEIPKNTSDESWADRQKAAEIVVAWVNQSRSTARTNLMTNSGGGYPSGVGGWMMRAWTVSGGDWEAAIGRGFVAINSAHNDLYKPGYGAGMTRGALLLHEIGHAMGLEHVGTTHEIMYPTMLNRSHSNYKDGDRTGLKKVGRPLGCIAGATDAWPQI
jgi:hypothetical protein